MSGHLESVNASVQAIHEMALKVTGWCDYDELAIPLAEKICACAYRAASQRDGCADAEGRERGAWAQEIATYVKQQEQEARRWFEAAQRMTDPLGEAVAMEVAEQVIKSGLWP